MIMSRGCSGVSIFVSSWTPDQNYQSPKPWILADDELYTVVWLTQHNLRFSLHGADKLKKKIIWVWWLAEGGESLRNFPSPRTIKPDKECLYLQGCFSQTSIMTFVKIAGESHSHVFQACTRPEMCESLDGWPLLGHITAIMGAKGPRICMWRAPNAACITSALYALARETENQGGGQEMLTGEEFHFFWSTETICNKHLSKISKRNT